MHAPTGFVPVVAWIARESFRCAASYIQWDLCYSTKCALRSSQREFTYPALQVVQAAPRHSPGLHNVTLPLQPLPQPRAARCSAALPPQPATCTLRSLRYQGRCQSQYRALAWPACITFTVRARYKAPPMPAPQWHALPATVGSGIRLRKPKQCTCITAAVLFVSLCFSQSSS